MPVKSLLKLGCGILSVCLAACQNTTIEKAGENPALIAQKQVEAAKYNMQLGISYLNQGDRPRGKRKLLTALTLAPQSADVHAAMAFFLEKTDDVAGAKRYYQKALSLEPKSGAQRNNYGAFLCRMGQYPEAERYFLEAGEDVHYVNSALAYENAGLCAELAKNEAKSQTYFLKALAQDPDRKESLRELVKLTLKQHKPETALTYLHQYMTTTIQDKDLLTLALRAAQEADKAILVADYSERLSVLKTGEEHEHDREST